MDLHSVFIPVYYHFFSTIIFLLLKVYDCVWKGVGFNIFRNHYNVSVQVIEQVILSSE